MTMDDQAVVTLERKGDDLPSSADASAGAMEAWRAQRRAMEVPDLWHTPDGVERRPPVEAADLVVKPLDAVLRATGLARWVYRRSLRVRRRAIELALPALPDALDGYRILHLTDPHFDALPGLADAIAEACRGVAADLVAITGDLRGPEVAPFREHGVIDDLARVLDGVAVGDGVLATLGNHDCEAMLPGLESRGVRVLMDEEVTLPARGVPISVVGLDDPHRFHGPASARCLARLVPAADRFRLFLVHSPELASVAAARGGHLYLSGHTHGGQICLPGGRPLVTHLHREKDLAVGLWRRGGMTGYTSPGAGVSRALPLRLFSESEVTLFTLRRAGDGEGPPPAL